MSDKEQAYEELNILCNALEQFDDDERQPEKRALILRDIGMIYFRQRNWQSAADRFIEALHVLPGSPRNAPYRGQLLCLMARVELARGNRKRAKQATAEAHMVLTTNAGATSPQWIEFIIWRAELCALLGEVGAATRWIMQYNKEASMPHPRMEAVKEFIEDPAALKTALGLLPVFEPPRICA